MNPASVLESNCCNSKELNMYKIFKSIKKLFPTHEKIHQLIANHKWLKFLLDNPVIWDTHEYAVTMGVAIGVFVGTLPIIMQMLIAALLAIAFRANVVVSILFTWVNNPLTIVPLNYLIYYVGSIFMVRLAESSEPAVNFTWDFSSFSGFWDSISLWGHHFGKAFLIGSPVVAFCLAFLSFIIAKIIYRLSAHRKSK